MFLVLIWDPKILETCQAKNATLGKCLLWFFHYYKGHRFFIFNIFFFIQNNIRHWTIMNYFPCCKILLMTCLGCICVKFVIGFSSSITWTCIVPCVICCSFASMEQTWIQGPLGIDSNGWSIGNHLDINVKRISWVCDSGWTRQLK
jgi:hypothetical protein